MAHCPLFGDDVPCVLILCFELPVLILSLSLNTTRNSF